MLASQWAEAMADSLVRELRAIVGRRNVLDATVDLQTYEYDAYLERSLPRLVVFVHSTAEVSAVVRLLAREGVPFVPRGGGTNISGGAIALHKAVVLEMGRMNRVLEIDLPNQRMLVQPGIFNLDISTALEPLGYYYAPDPASQKACSLGGNVAENAGGPHCFKYGVTSNHVLGIEVVLPDGEVVWLGGRSHGSLGFDLTGVFVGSEGTLGVATAAILRVLRKPEAVKTLLAVCGSIEEGGHIVSAIVAAGLVPATLEMMDNRTINAVEESMACGFPREAAAVLLIELDGLLEGMDEMAEQIVAICRANGVQDVRVAQDEAERAALWKGRKGAFGAISRLAPNYLVADGTVPRTELPEALRRVAEIGCRYDLNVASVFHAGDGNLHPLLLFDSRKEEDRKSVMAAGLEVLRVCVDLGGTVSGEHGIGIEKLDAMRLVFDEADLRAQAFVKDAFDPRGLCNPGKVLPGPAAPPEAGASASAAEAAGANRGAEAPKAAKTPVEHYPAGDRLADRLATLLGEERVDRRPTVAIHDIPAPLGVFPADEDQLSAILALANREGLGVCVAGGGTKLGWGNRPGRFDLLLRTRDLRGFSHVDADNLSLSAAAGMTIAEVRARAASVGRVLPLDPQWPGFATIGGVTATADQGARGAGFGGLRDVVLGVRAVLADGSVVKFGGRTMKNVTGYDVTKLFIGSFGALGVLTEVTFRLLPRPGKQALMVIPLTSLGQGGELAAQIIDSHLQPLALEVISPACVRAVSVAAAEAGTLLGGVETDIADGESWLLLAAFAGHPATVGRSVREVSGRFETRPPAVLEDERAESVLDTLANAGPKPMVSGSGLALRASLPLREAWAFAEAAVSGAEAAGFPLACRIGAARGTVDLTILGRAGAAEPEAPSAGTAPLLGDFVSGLRGRAVAAGGHLVVRDGLTLLPLGFDAWGDPGPSVGLMRRIKDRFDPHGVLNPRRYVGGM
ncbi:MAG: hypothetical protein A2133_00435 [Actinobacteria bacterium RBG_16_64_13]|nr:MAG: hypothetical protein A2133_00435 [Actinobacteria bacterium RBG_16_64_13]